MRVILSYKSKNIKGELSGFPDKSISHRAIILSSMSKGTSKIVNLLNSEDVFNTINCFKSLEVNIIKKNGEHIVESQGFYSFSKKKDNFYMGNSGTSCRLISGVLAGIEGKISIITGDESLIKRPMLRVIRPLELMEAKFTQRDNRLPLKIIGNQLKGINYQLDVPSAQVKSAILLGGLFAKGQTQIIETDLSRDHTENMMFNLGVNINIDFDGNKKIITLNNNQKNLPPSEYFIPNDFSSASFFIALSIITENSKILIKKVNMNPLRTGFLKVLKEMGAKIEILNLKSLQGEVIGDLFVESSLLKGIKVDPNLVTSMIDELPILFIVSCFAEGITEFNNIEELRYKESDRVSSMTYNLKKLGVKLEENKDSLKIYGVLKEIKGGIEVESFLDHRIAMSFLILGSKCKLPLKVKGCDSIATSFPNFFDVAKSTGLQLEIIE